MRNTLLLLSLGCILFSCKDDDEGNIAGGSSTPNCRLVKEVSGSVTDYIYIDDLLVKKKSYTSSGLSDSVEYIYDSNNRVKYILENEFGSISLDTSYTFEYDAFNRLIKISEIDDELVISTTELNYVNGRFNNSVYKDYLGNTNQITVELESNENIIKFSGSSRTYKYDDKVNPFKGLVDERFLLERYFSPNNPTSIETIVGSDTSIQNNHYTYNSQGYPTKISTVINGMTYESSYFYECF